MNIKRMTALAAAIMIGTASFSSIYGQVSATDSVKKENTLKSSYHIVKESYEDKKIKISYPQITNMKDTKKQTKINEMIKNDALRFLKDFEDDREKVSADIDYTIKYQGENLLSILYLGFANIEGAVHPTNMIYTTNINMKEAKRITLSDLVKIDQDLLTQLKKGKYQKWTKDIDLKAAGALQTAVTGLVGKEVLDELKDKNVSFYLTKDALVISISVAHVLGDHIELAIDYKNIKDKIINKKILGLS